MSPSRPLQLYRCPSCPYRAKSRFHLTRHLNKCRLHAATIGTNSTSSSPRPYRTTIPYTPRPSFAFDIDPLHHDHVTSTTSSPPTDIQTTSHIAQLSTFLIELSRLCGIKQVNALLKLLHSDNLDLALFKSSLRSVKDCEQIAFKTSQQFIQSNGFTSQSIITKCQSGDSVTSTLHISNPLQLIQKQLSVLDHLGALHFRPQSSSSSHRGPFQPISPMSTSFFSTLFHKKRSHVMRCSPPDVIWNDDDPTFPKSFVPFIQVFTDKTATSLSSSAFVAYPIHLVVLNTSAERREWLINNGLTILGFLPASVASGDDSKPDFSSNILNTPSADDASIIDLRDGISSTSSSSGRETNMLVLQNAISTALKSLDDIALKGYAFRASDSSLWNWFPLLVSYCCDIPEAKNVFAIRHGTRTIMPCVRCTSSPSNFHLWTSSPCRHRSHTSKVRHTVSVIQEQLHKAEQTPDLLEKTTLRHAIATEFNNYSLSSWSSFLENSNLVPSTVIDDLYSIYTYEPLHNIHLGLSVRLKDVLTHYLGTSKSVTINGRLRTYCSLRHTVLKGCNSLLRSIQDLYTMPGIRYDFSKKECSTALNGIYTNTGLRGMLEGKDYKVLDTIFPIVFAYVDTWLSDNDSAPLTEVHTLYTDIINTILSDNHGNGWIADDLDTLQSEIKIFKTKMVGLFHDCCPNGLGTLKFHLFDHIVDDIRRFGTISVLSASPFEHFNLHIKSAYRSTSKRLLTREMETAHNLNCTLKRRILHDTISKQNSSGTQSPSTPLRLGLVSSGIKLSVMHFSESNGTPSIPSDNFVTHLRSCIYADALKQFSELLQEHLQSTKLIPFQASVTIVQSGYIDGGLRPTIEDCQSVEGTFLLKTSRNYIKRRQRVFGLSWDRPNLRRKQSFVVIKGLEGDDLDVFWVGQVILLFHLHDRAGTVKEELAFVQFMEVTQPLSSADKALKCVCLRWATDDNVDYTLDPGRQIERGQMECGEWYGFIPFNSIVGTVQVVRSNIAVPPFTNPSPWPLHRFYVNRFSLEKDIPFEDNDPAT